MTTHDEPRAHGGRADQPRRARLRHLLAPAEGADHLPDRAGRGRHGGADLLRSCSSWSPRTPRRKSPMYINSPGGIVTSALAIYDTMQYIKSPVSTVRMGMAASAGSLILQAGEAGRRIALPNARIMVHQPSGGFRGQASDIERHAEDIIKTKKRLNEIYAKHTGQPIEVVERALDRDNFMSAEEAKALRPGRPRLRDPRKRREASALAFSRRRRPAGSAGEHLHVALRRRPRASRGRPRCRHRRPRAGSPVRTRPRAGAPFPVRGSFRQGNRRRPGPGRRRRGGCRSRGPRRGRARTGATRMSGEAVTITSRAPWAR